TPERTATPPPVRPKPSATPPPRPVATTTWYTSPAAVAAAQRMAADGVVGDPVCSLAAVGRVDPHLVPQGRRIGIGAYGTYWCLIW
ncbi:hypothetical protein N4P33_32440, partial [Streptomyces sp. 15-116A]|uniref:hypothetical protein n=1 Tax=Streptomyces sp. 15-116A TaxID=2259035 RepID=UPI0021B1822E